MKRGPKPVTSASGENKSDLVKKTFLFDRNVSQHLAVAALVTGREQADIVREATEARLKAMGCDLTRPPELPNLRPVSGTLGNSGG